MAYLKLSIYCDFEILKTRRNCTKTKRFKLTSKTLMKGCQTASIDDLLWPY